VRTRFDIELMTITNEPELTPAEMSHRTGVSIDTLRYYEREGLLTNVARADSGHRRYSTDDVLWVEVLRCLRNTGMSIDQLRHYCSLGQQGQGTAPERMAMLSKHRALLVGQMGELRLAIDLIDHKLDHYRADAAALDAAATATSTGTEPVPEHAR
jgi:MerR family transcriptional regulator, aldehyde-responsive regulator